MSKADQFWEYAKEATLSACYAQDGHDSRVCLSLRASGRKRRYESELPRTITTMRLRLWPRKVGRVLFTVRCPARFQERQSFGWAYRSE